MAKTWITEAKERAEKAAKGPWEIEAPQMDEKGWFDQELCNPDGGVMLHRAMWKIRNRDAAFIAAARTDVPRLATSLLEAVEALEKVADSGCVTPDFPCDTEQMVIKAPDHWLCPSCLARRVLARILTPTE